ncbi:hypothetical protein K8B83_14930 [Shewanella inventionis]|uniref:DUF7694 domain-containing protein n=1 Tax=Shewanella inventionis TaxID=1738770 RepID=UPI001CBCF701|nr:hypothetical protein [Shewanella inventionis]UAL42168.1 hypothetical protein K8B83_14930 [Shewanella inventionis]
MSTQSLKSFTEIPKQDWPPHQQKTLVRVLLSSEFLVQQFVETDGLIRLSICKTNRKGNRWADGITWDQLQEIKMHAGFGSKCAVEVFPEDSNVVNVANMRHIFILPERPAFAWTKQPSYKAEHELPSPRI